MDKIRIKGGEPLQGTIRISGAKNAALPLMATTLLTDQEVILKNVPNLMDIHSMAALLEQLGVVISQEEQASIIKLKGNAIQQTTASYDLVRKMRASILVLGPLVARHHQARVSLPGGCVIGTRPVDIHIEGLKQLGADIDLNQGYIEAKAPKGLKGTEITLPLVSVTATENLMMAACLAKGQTRLNNAAREPEIVDLAHCLISMGGQITGAGSDTVIIEGVESLQGTEHTVIPDRIETGTYMMAAAITRGTLQLTHTSLSLLPTISASLAKAGVEIEEIPNGIRIFPPSSDLQGVDVMTEPFPGFATDLQAQMMALMTMAKGAAMLTETIFENRFMHVPELRRMGADITVHRNASALVRGTQKLMGAPVMATDIRASVCLVLAALAAEGETVISRVYHLDRGYEKIENKLRACGASIERFADS